MLRFEWDPAKSELNRSKHGIDFETAKFVFYDPLCVTFVERVLDNEDRWHAIGSIADIIIVVVVHTYREEGPDEIVRIISTRRATLREKRLYEEAIG